jgi:hypothetical protein
VPECAPKKFPHVAAPGNANVNTNYPSFEEERLNDKE